MIKNHPFAIIGWRWFHCTQTGKCIDNSNRCDKIPHPECIFVNKTNGENVAEDEEGCFEEYRRKNLVDESANFICQSPDHNDMSKAIGYTDFLGRYFTVIPNGTKVRVLSTRCNGIPECWNNEDEDKCNPNSTETIFTGKLNKNFIIIILCTSTCKSRTSRYLSSVKHLYQQIHFSVSVSS